MILLRIYGVVQGVGFRPFIWRMAHEVNIRGFVKNKGGFVEIEAEGDEGELERFKTSILERLPNNAFIDRMEELVLPDPGHVGFSIVESEDVLHHILSGIPPDIATCSKCLQELKDPGDRRYRYPFTNCTDCGPRFTIVTSTPYDRVKTSMRVFRMCDECESEYKDPKDRRYHAEPIACPNNGPSYFLSTPDADIHDNAIERASELLDGGEIVAIKGLGGFHIACDATNDDTVERLRDTLGRKGQPFAIMARDIEALSCDLEVDEGSEAHMLSAASPIVVLLRRGRCSLPESIAPGLATIGAMLPYAPVHHILFSTLKTPCLVMTSANYPGNPMITRLSEARSNLPFIKNFLSHDLEIVNRCDDSVIRDNKFIRRSRGYVPLPIPCPNTGTTIAFGAELNNVVAVTKGGKCVLSQHIGDTSNWDVMESALESLRMLMRIAGVGYDDIDYILCDRHPQYNSSIVASEWAERLSKPIVRVQHHMAHAFALASEHHLDEILCIAADGTGYGDDGHSWGGELFYTDRDPCNTLRLGHLEYIKIPGGDLSAKHPLRILIPILGSSRMEDYAKFFRGGMDEMRSIESYSRKGAPLTSSTGRILDSISAMLGVSMVRTYEGEGPMKLESLALKGRDIGLEIGIDGCIARTSEFIAEIYDLMPTSSKQDIAMTAHASLSRAFLAMVEENVDMGLPVGFSGGVAHNAIISKMLKRGVESMGLRFLEHRRVPPGDGGTSFGQSCASIK